MKREGGGIGEDCHLNNAAEKREDAGGEREGEGERQREHRQKDSLREIKHTGTGIG